MGQIGLKSGLLGPLYRLDHYTATNNIRTKNIVFSQTCCRSRVMTVFSIQISNKIGLKCLIKALLIPLRPLLRNKQTTQNYIVFSQTCCRSRVMTSISYELLTNYRAIKAILYEKSSKKAKNDQKALKMAKNPKNPPFL